MTKVVTRFAPSPTGSLHIGSARTAIFNFLFAKKNNGKFLLRIEDTDRVRSTQKAINEIKEGLGWLNLENDDEIIMQSQNADRHSEIAKKLLENGNAYYCYLTPEEVEEMKLQNQVEGKSIRNPWRDKDGDGKIWNDIKPVVRMKSPNIEKVSFTDRVYGEISVAGDQIDDQIIMRSDGTCTYMLAVVVDDHDMAVSHVIRGTDHINNTLKQKLLYESMGWNIPEFVHIPLIHGADGAKLSKRHGALYVMEYKNQGILPETMNNYLLRLGWSHKDEEIIDRKKAIELFSINGIGKSPARFDEDKLMYLNKHYINISEPDYIYDVAKHYIVNNSIPDWNDKLSEYLNFSVNVLANRAHSIVEISDMVNLINEDPLPDHDALEIIAQHPNFIQDLEEGLSSVDQWNKEELDNFVKNITKSGDITKKSIFSLARALIIGRGSSPSILDIMVILGKEECIKRICRFIASKNNSRTI